MYNDNQTTKAYWMSMGYDPTTSGIKAADIREHRRYHKMVLRDIKNLLDVDITIGQKRRGSSVYHVMENGKSVFSGFLWRAEEYLEELIEEYNAIINPIPTNWSETVAKVIQLPNSPDEEYFV